MGRAHPPAAVRRIRLLSLVLCAAAAASAAPAAARAQDEVPPAVRALDGSEAARRALAAAPDADDLVTQWLRDADRRDRLGPAALESLADLAAERRLTLANSGLRALLRDEAQPVAVRRAAARALERTGSIADVGALADALLALPGECSRALAAIGGDAAVGALRRGAGDAPPPEALAALAKLGDRASLAALAAELGDPAARDRVHALLRWATSRDLPAEPAAWADVVARLELAERLTVDDVDAVQAYVETLAAAVRGGGPDGAATEARLAALLGDGEAPAAARGRAALVLGLAGTKAHNELLLRCCANLQPGEVRLAAAGALARVGDLSCAVPLASMLVHDEDRDRLRAKRNPRNDYVPVDPEFARVLTRLGLRGGIVPLFDLMAGEYRSALQRDSLRAVQELSGGESFGFDTDAASKDRKAAVARMRAWWLDARTAIPVAPRADDPGRAAFDAHVAALVAKLGAFKFLDQMRAKNALVIVAEGARGALVAGLSDPELRIRTGVAEVMRGTALREFAAPLAARIAADPHPAARTRMLWALETCGRRGADGAVPDAAAVRAAVRAALADRSLDVRIAAARALGVVGDAGTDAPLLRAARGEAANAADDFRTASAGALLLLGDRSAAADVVAQLRSDDVAQRAEGRRVLDAAGIDVRGYDPDADADTREAAVRVLEAGVSPGAHR